MRRGDTRATVAVTKEERRKVELDRALMHGNRWRGIDGARGALEARYRDDPEALRRALIGAELQPD